jgi:ABC-type Fe3+ transport system substrate-binding protein
LDGDPLRRLAAAARSERTLIARGLTDPASMRDVIWPAFRADVAPWAEIDYAQDVIAGRVLGAVRDADPDRRPAVVLVSNPILFDRAGLLEPMETPFAAHFPAGWIDADRRWLPVYVQPIVAIHNAHHTAPPREWADLAEARLRGRVVFDDPARMLTSGPAFAELSTAWGDDAWSAALAAMAAVEPRLVADNERAVLEVSTGSRWMGLANWNVARRIRAGSPVRHTFLRPTPCVPGFGLLLAGAPAGSLGRLFLAWLSSEGGQRAYAATGRVPARPDVAATPSLASVLPPGVEPLFGAADWVSSPERWVDRYQELFPADRGAAAEGKLR